MTYSDWLVDFAELQGVIKDAVSDYIDGKYGVDDEYWFRLDSDYFPVWVDIFKGCKRLETLEVRDIMG